MTSQEWNDTKQQPPECQECGIRNGEVGERVRGDIGTVRVRRSKIDKMTLCGNCRYLYKNDLR